MNRATLRERIHALSGGYDESFQRVIDAVDAWGETWVPDRVGIAAEYEIGSGLQHAFGALEGKDEAWAGVCGGVVR